MLSLFLAASLTFSDANARTAYVSATTLVSNYTPRDAGTPRGRMAASYIANAAIANGANARIDYFDAATPQGMRTFANVVAEWSVCATGDWVVVVSHYDTKPFTNCPGANDGASTSGLLIGLAQALSYAPVRPGNVMLMWLDGEECMFSYGAIDGLWGSKRAAATLRNSRRNVRAVICVDMLGDANLNISLPRNTTPELRRVALESAKRTGHAKVVEEIRELVKDDHLPFLDAGYKAIDLIDFEYGSAPGLNDYWHTSKDTIDKISSASLQTSGEILCDMITQLLK